MSVNTNASRTNWLIHGVGVTVVLALSAVFVFACVTPRFKTRSQRIEQGGELNDLRTNIRRTNSRVRSLEDNLQSTTRTAGEKSVRLTPAHQFNRRLEELTTLLNDCELTIDSMKPEPPTRNDRLSSVKILIEGVGTYPHYAWFLQRAHKQFPELAVAAFELTSRGSGGDGGNHGSGGNRSDRSDRGASVSFRLGMILYIAPDAQPGLQEASVDVDNPDQRDGSR